MAPTSINQLFALYPLILALFGAAGFVALVAWRPAAGCGLFALSTPLITGLGRGTVIPLLKPNEAVLLLLLTGLVIHYLPRGLRRPIRGLDYAVGGYTVGVVAIALVVLLISDSSSLTDRDTLRAVLSPLQFLIVYIVFSRVEIEGRGLVLVLNLTMLASVLVGLLAAAEMADLPGIRDFVASSFPPPFTAVSRYDPGYRPMSTLGHYSAVGAFAAANYSLALTLAAVRHPNFSKAWLNIVIVVNLVALIASLTWAPLIVLPLITGYILWSARRVPRELVATVLALAVALILFLPAVTARSANQGVFVSSSDLFTIPASFQYRLLVWQAFFLPALSDHPWLGTGTVIPSEVPTPLTNFVDNEYLREAFRAGLAGLTLMLVLLAAVAVAAWRRARSPDLTAKSLGTVLFANVVFFLLVGFTAEYMFFAGVSQEFAMLIGLVAAGGRATANVTATRVEQSRPDVGQSPSSLRFRPLTIRDSGSSLGTPSR